MRSTMVYQINTTHIDRACSISNICHCVTSCQASYEYYLVDKISNNHEKSTIASTFRCWTEIVDSSSITYKDRACQMSNGGIQLIRTSIKVKFAWHTQNDDQIQFNQNLSGWYMSRTPRGVIKCARLVRTMKSCLVLDCWADSRTTTGVTWPMAVWNGWHFFHII